MDHKIGNGTGGVKITGVCTATSFSGDGSALTSITASGSGVVDARWFDCWNCGHTTLQT